MGFFSKGVGEQKKKCGVFFKRCGGAKKKCGFFSKGVGEQKKKCGVFKWCGEKMKDGVGKIEKRGGENRKNGVGKIEKRCGENMCGEKYVWVKLKNEMKKFKNLKTE